MTEKYMPKNPSYLTWAEIDLNAIRRNVKAIERLAAKQLIKPPFHSRPSKKKGHWPEILTVVKADAYGHGMLEVARLLEKMNVDLLGVSDVQEGAELRRNKIKKTILLLENPLPFQARDIVKYQLTPMVCTMELALALNQAGKRAGRKIDIHVKVDTGMGRLGVWYDEAEGFITKLLALPFISLKGIFTHFPVADTNPKFTQNQVKKLYDLIRRLDRDAKIVMYVHAANSMGLAGYKMEIFNLVRPGLMLYGLYPSAKFRKNVQLTPAMSIKTTVIFVKEVHKGRGISYGHSFVAQKKMRIATLPIGYSDGYLRALSNKGEVLINGKRCPVIGRVTMDQIMVDVSKLKSVKEGAEAVVMGKQGKEEISADELAQKAGTICYEIVCSLGNRLPRIYKA